MAEEIGGHGEIARIHNIVLLGVVLISVFVTHPSFLREALMIAAAAGTYLSTKCEVHKKNDFDFAPIKEVAILFVGIFATMVPALVWIGQNAAAFGFERAGQFYWSTGALSSALDNTPTYLNFLTAASGLFVDDGLVRHIFHLVQLRGSALSSGGGKLSGDLRRTYVTLLNYDLALMASGDPVRAFFPATSIFS